MLAYLWKMHCKITNKNHLHALERELTKLTSVLFPQFPKLVFLLSAEMIQLELFTALIYQSPVLKTQSAVTP